MGKLHEETRIDVRDGSRFATLHRDWDIWGPNGGYVASIALRAVGTAAPPEHRPASISIQYLSVAQFAEVEAQVEPVRQGRNACCFNVALVQNGKRFLQAQVWTTNKTDGPSSAEIKMPDVPKPDTLKNFEDYLPKDAPRSTFWANLQSRPTKWIPWGESDPRGARQEQWYRFPAFDSGGDPFAACMQPLLLIDTLIWPTWHRGRARRARLHRTLARRCRLVSPVAGRQRMVAGGGTHRHRQRRPDPRHRPSVVRRRPPARQRRQPSSGDANKARLAPPRLCDGVFSAR